MQNTSINKKLFQFILEQNNGKTYAGFSLLDTELYGHNLFLIGKKHSYKLSDPSFRRIEKLFITFARSNKNFLVLLENPVRVTISLRKKIKLSGESGFLEHLAKKSGIKTRSIEPRSSQMLNLLKSMGYKNNDIAVWVLSQRLSSTPKNLKNQNAILSDINKEFKTSLQFHDSKLHDSIFLKRMSNAINSSRDYFIVSNLFNLLKRYSIFSVYGYNHFHIIKNVIKKRREIPSFSR